MGRSCPQVEKKKWGGKRVIFDFTSANLLKHTWFCVFNRNNSRKYIIIVIDEWDMWCRRQIDAPPFPPPLPPGAGGCMTFSKIKKKQRGKGLLLLIVRWSLPPPPPNASDVLLIGSNRSSVLDQKLSSRPKESREGRCMYDQMQSVFYICKKRFKKNLGPPLPPSGGGQKA